MDIDIAAVDTANQTPRYERRAITAKVNDDKAVERKHFEYLGQPPFCKIKAQSLLKLIPGRGWAKVAPIFVYSAKCVQMPDQSCLVIGGSSD